MNPLKSILFAFMIVFLFSVWGCQSQTVVPEDEGEPPYPVSPEQPSEAVFSAFDSALAYLRENFGEEAPPQDLKWDSERITEEGLVGGERFRFTAGDWRVVLSYPVVRLDLTVYSLEVENSSSSFYWEGEVDAEGNVGQKAPDLVAEAFYATLAYLLQNHPDRAPEVGLPWISRDATPKDVVGSGIYEFMAGDWLVTVSYPIVAPEATVYHVRFLNQSTGFQWEGEVDAGGQVSEISVSE